MAKEVYIPYGMTEQEIRKNFLDWVILGDNTPIDIAYKAEITDVTKTFYPIRVVSSEYKAEWSALSIWEHKEEYKVSVPMVKYREVLTYTDDHKPSLTKIHIVTKSNMAVIEVCSGGL